eukprot:331205_1
MFLTTLIAIAFIYALEGKSIVPAWKDCSGNSDKGTVTNVVFNAGKTIPFDVNFTITATGTTSEALADPSYIIHIKDGLFVNTDIQGDGCQPNVYNFPLDAGAFYWSALTCPVPAGPLVINLIANIGSGAPTGTATTTTRFYDRPNQQGNEVVCVEVDLSITRDEDDLPVNASRLLTQ